LESDYKKLENDLKKCETSQQEKLVYLGKLKSEEEQRNRRIHERDDLLVSLARRFQWPGHLQYEHPLGNKYFIFFVVLNLLFGVSIGDDRVTAYQNNLKDALKQAKQDEIDTKKRLEQEEKVLIESKSKIRDERVRLEQEIKTKYNAILSLEKEFDEVTFKLNELESNSRQLSSIERQQKDAQAQVEQEEKQVNVNEVKDQIDQAKYIIFCLLLFFT
jgi:hypothetical protein